MIFIFRHTIAAQCALFTLMTSVLAQSSPNFLHLPYDDSTVVQQQAPLYDNGRVHAFGLPFDYFKYANGDTQTFQVRAAAAGYAMQTCQDVSACDTKGFGQFVLIRHAETDENGQHYYTLYAHLESIEQNIPYRSDKHATDYQQWEWVEAGEVIGMAGQTGDYECLNTPSCIHLHFEVFAGGYAKNPVDPYDLSFYTPGLDLGRLPQSSYFPNVVPGCGPNYLWTECPPSLATSIPTDTFVVQPGPSNSKDIWTTSVFSYDGSPGNIGFGGGGRDNEELRVGGWGDLYYSLLEFDISGLPETVSSAYIELHPFPSPDTRFRPVGMQLYRITDFWDWRTMGSGPDRERLWWVDRPPAVPWTADEPQPMPAPISGEPYRIDITNLYNAWQADNNNINNFGIQLRPTGNFANQNYFRSSEYSDDPSLRPKLVVIPSSSTDDDIDDPPFAPQ